MNICMQIFDKMFIEVALSGRLCYNYECKGVFLMCDENAGMDNFSDHGPLGRMMMPGR